MCRSKWKGIALLILASILTVVPACAGTISDSTGSFIVGIGSNGELFDYGTGIGFQRVSDGYDPLSPGTPRDSWGLSVNGTGVYADQAYGSSSGLTGSNSVYGPNSATVTTTTSLGFSVVQTYFFVTANMLAVAGTVTNNSGIAGNVLYQRDVDWDVAPTAFNETSSGSAISGNVIQSSYYGFEVADPTKPYFFSCAAGCSETGDLGGGIKLNLGLIAPGSSKGFEYLYGINMAGQSPEQLLGQAHALGASYSILTKSSDPSGTNSAIIATVSDAPEPATIGLLLLGLGAIAGVRKRQHR